MDALLWMLLAGAGWPVGAALAGAVRVAGPTAIAAGAGLLLAATLLGLLPEAAEEATPAQLAIGLVGGFALTAALDRTLSRRSSQGAVLLTGAIALHNVPEGIGVGSAFAGGGAALGVPLALGVLAHNLPLGLAMALPLRGLGAGVRRTVVGAALAGVAGALGALAAVLVGEGLDASLPWILAAATGALLYVIADELVPVAVGRRPGTSVVVAAAAFVVMAAVLTALDALVG